MDPYIRRFVRRLEYLHSNHRYFIDLRHIGYTVHRWTAFVTFSCLTVSLCRLRLASYCAFQQLAQHVGVLRRAFQDVTPSFHSLEYQFSIQKFCICLVSCLCSYQGTCRTHIISASDRFLLFFNFHFLNI